MPSTTTNLGLYKKNPSTDGNDTFDINTMLNDNWDRLDAQLGAQFADAAPTAVNLVNGLQVVDVPQTAPLENLRITGRTLVNLLGRDGNCEDLGRWSVFQSTQALNSVNVKYGNNSIKVTATAANYTATCRNYISLPSGNKYLVLAEFNAGTAPYAAIEVTPAIGTSNGITTTTGFGLAYRKFISTGLVGINLYTIATAAGQFFYVDGVRLYALSDAEYSAIDGMTVAQIAAKYPYVDDVKHINSPYVIKYGENLLPTFNEWILHANSTVITPNTLTLVATAAGQRSGYTFTPVVGQSYTLSFSGISSNTNVYAEFTDASGTLLAAPSLNALPATFIPVTSTAKVTIWLDSFTSGTYSFTNPMLNLGATAKPFKPRNDDMLAFPNVQLASNMDGTVYDMLFKRDGKYFVEKRFKDIVLDGGLDWLFNADGIGYKSAYWLSTAGFAVQDSATAVKYSGKILNKLQYAVPTDADQIANGGEVNSVIISIADADSGWGETYVPTTQEIQAFFYGWKMYDNVNTLNLYNSGTKAWVRVSKIVNGVFTGVGGIDTTLTLPSAASGAGYAPYKLTYKLATPTFEEIQVDGSISLHEGLNQIEAGQGVIVREKVIPDIVSGTSVELNQISLSPLMRRTNRILSVYRSGKIDLAWQLSNNNITAYWNGGGAATISSVSNYDKAATYEVSYIALDQYLLCSPLQVITGETASNLKMLVDALAINDSDQYARISEAERLARQIYNVPKNTSAAMTLYVDTTNGADNNDGSTIKPFKTINRAISVIPQVVNHIVTIVVAAGIYAENVVISGFSGSSAINLVGSGTTDNTRVVTNISVVKCSCKVQIFGMNPNVTNNTTMYVADSTDVFIANLKIDATSATNVGIFAENSNVYINSSSISNRYEAVYAHVNGNIYSQSLSGSGNTYSFFASYNGRIATDNTKPSSFYGNVAQQGGIISDNGGGVINPWGDNTFSNRSASSAYQATGQTLTGGTTTKIICSNLNFDNQNEYSAGRFTAKKSGHYLVSLTAAFPPLSGFVAVALYKNGGQNAVLCNGGTISSSNNVFTGTIATLLSAGDYIEMYVFTSVGVTLASGSIFNITQIA